MPAIAQVMMWHEEAALSQKRDAAPLRLLSWLTFGLPRKLTSLLEQLMEHFAQYSVPQMDHINEILQDRFRPCESLTSREQVRDFIVQKICSWNEQWQPTSLLLLFEGFLKKYSLARLTLFLDMILPQLEPVHTRWDDPSKSPPSMSLFSSASTPYSSGCCSGENVVPVYLSGPHVYGEG